MPDSLDWLDDALADLDRRALLRRLAINARRAPGPETQINGQSLINFGSNDYLGLASDPRLAAAARSAIETHGWGAAASPLVTGRSDLHAQLEQALADFEAAEAALLFPTGYAANVGAITALVGKGDAIYSDELNHASIIDGCRLSGAAIHIYPHSSANGPRDADLQRLADLLRGSRDFRRRLIVTESLFSMHGTIAPLPELAKLARQHDAMLMVDEAHATGVFGQHGRGLCEHLAVENLVDVRVGTLSKALGSHGGFVAGSQQLIAWLANRARTYVFSTASPPATAAAGLAALDLIRQQPQRRQRLHELVKQLTNGCQRETAFRDSIPSTAASPIIPIILGDPSKAVAAAANLRHRGFLVPAIRPPSVPNGQSLLRISLTSLHTEQQINSLIAALTDLPR